MNRIGRYLSIAAIMAGLTFGQSSGSTPPSPPDPATMVQMRVAMLTSLLGLTDAQQTQATTIFTNAVTAAQAVQINEHTARQSLLTAIQSNDTASIDTLSQTIGGLVGQVIGINAKANAAFYAILTADQQTKYNTLPPGFGMGPGGPGGLGGPGGPGGPGGAGPSGLPGGSH
jgi:Spy/CpxP family protein refolding chaperone